LKRRWPQGNTRPDYIVIDTAPSVGGLQEASIWAADVVIVPCATDFLSTDGVVKIVETMDRLAGHGWPGALLGILPTFYDEVTKESTATLDDLRATFGAGKILEPIHRATALREAAAEGLTIWEAAPRSRAASEYAQLVWGVLNAT
jgi:chromosome partitioning protein